MAEGWTGGKRGWDEKVVVSSLCILLVSIYAYHSDTEMSSKHGIRYIFQIIK